ncbi:MAG: hypothetical protein QNK32_09600, partial [Porticoccus sp.]|nr:hypothetical protein [Porticoccus sp.]
TDTVEKLTPEIKKQLEFIEWLKANDIYNPMESSHTMRQMHRVWEESRSPGCYVAKEPIETAPKDGTYILVFGKQFDGGCAVVCWDGDWWYLDNGKDPEIALRGDKPTRWMPTPAAT